MLQLHKPHFIFSLCLVLLLSMVPAAYAAPPLQGDGSTLGDSLNLNEDGTPVDEGDDTSGGNNLGTVMSGKDDEATEEDPSAGETPEAEPTPEGDTGEVDAKQHPVAAALSEYFDVEYDEIMTLHEEGNGFGNIAKAYFFADQLGLTPEELLSEAHDSGWGNVLKENGIHPGSVGNGGGNKDVPGQENGAKGPKNSDAPDLTGQSGHGGGNGNGGGNGHGGGNGNGGGNGHGNGHGGGNGNGGGNGHGGGNGNGGGNGHGNGRGNN